MSRIRQFVSRAARTRFGVAVRKRLERARRRRHRTHVHQTYSEQELLARTEEFNRNAERHWRSIAEEPAGRGHALNKPFSTVRDTPSILYRLGLVLDALDLGVGHTVLDFGAGSCWLSSCLNRLNCRTVSIDVSPTALALGEELFRLDPRHRSDFEPRFLPYDGHRIPLPDASVDRAVCFDAFHHVPNQDEVLSELHRVVKQGGRVVLAEPGEGHAHSDQSQFETERCGVLENDMHLEDLLPRARKAGFDRVLMKPYPDPSAYTLTGEEYLRLIDGYDHLYPLHVLRDHLRHFYVIVLGKGESRRDSRNPGKMLARLTPRNSRAVSGSAGERVILPVAVKNRGDTIWLHVMEPAGGYVSLGGHLLDEQRRTVAVGYLRALLPRDVSPGETVDVEAVLSLPAALGRYVLRLDMVDESVVWFEQCGSPTVDVDLVVESYPDSRRPHFLGARIELPDGPPSGPVRPGSPLTLTVRVTNLGDTIWLDAPEGSAGRVALGGHLVDQRDQMVAWEHFRAGFGRSVAPGESVTVRCAFPAPPETGRYRLILDLVSEQVCWFESHGSSRLDVVLETTGEVPDSRCPGLLRARIERPQADRPLEVSLAASATVPLRITNTGNTRWLDQPRPEGGHVAIGGHLYDDTGALIALDLFRTRLPRAVDPGETVEVACTFPGPPTPGQYRLELDLVDESVAWFASRGSPTLDVTLVAR